MHPSRLQPLLPSKPKPSSGGAFMPLRPLHPPAAVRLAGTRQPARLFKPERAVVASSFWPLSAFSGAQPKPRCLHNPAPPALLVCSQRAHCEVPGLPAVDVQGDQDVLRVPRCGEAPLPSQSQLDVPARLALASPSFPKLFRHSPPLHFPCSSSTFPTFTSTALPAPPSCTLSLACCRSRGGGAWHFTGCGIQRGQVEAAGAWTSLLPCKHP